MQLFYDGTCSLCTSIAFKVHFLSGRSVEIVPLATPEAKTTLDGFYPDGWKWDFYVVARGQCSRGLRTIPKLLPKFDMKALRSLVQHLGGPAKRARCAAKGAKAAKGKSILTERRTALQAMALTPFMYALSRVPVEAAVETSGADIEVNIASVSVNGKGFHVDARACADCVKPRTYATPKKGTRKIVQENRRDTVLAEIAAPMTEDGPLFGELSGPIPALRLTESSFTVRYEDGGAAKAVALYGGILTGTHYNASINAGRDLVSTMSGMIQHKIAEPIIDRIVCTETGAGADTHLRGQAAAIGVLRERHRNAGRSQLSAVYGEIEQAVLDMAQQFETHVDPLATSRSTLTLTALPDLLGSVVLPKELQLDPATLPSDVVQPMVDCDCSCSCCIFSCGCGCGCGCGCDCTCGCCPECGCGCGCCIT
jgi:hypothetical protein